MDSMQESSRTRVVVVGEFYFRPHHRSAQLLDPDQIDLPKIRWSQSSGAT
jgi:hypothetical protein